MKLYRFAIQPAEEGYFYLECVNDPRLFTQARSLDEALYMARDVVETVHRTKAVLIELVIPSDVVTKFETQKRLRRVRSVRRERPRELAAARK